LIRLRNVGAADGTNVFGASPLGLSPDGRRIAFVINRSDPDTGGYCQALATLELLPRHAPRVIDRGGERIIDAVAVRGSIVSDGGSPIITPAWSPDGRWVGYLKRIDGVTQLWLAASDGSGGRMVSHGGVDIENWAWLPGGTGVVVATRPGLVDARRNVVEEGRSGWLYDNRLWLGMSASPLPPASVPLVATTIDLAGAARPASRAEQQNLPSLAAPGTSYVSAVVDSRGWRVFTERTAPSPISPQRIVVSTLDGRKIACAAAACNDGAVRLWWSATSVLFLRREGWAHEDLALYRWHPGSRAPHRVFVTSDVLLGCVLATSLICTRESSADPRKIVSIDTRSGRSRLLVDPNPEFRAIRLGPVTRLKSTNLFGLQSWADLVMPPGKQGRAKVPMIIVQYHSRGFLRGGTGDDYPVFLFAARGYAVLSIEVPPHISSAFPDLKTYDELNAIGMKDWGERRNIQSSLDAAIDRALATGRIDPKRIGITGLSDGSTTVQFALINHNRFAAAAISSCCIEPTTVMTQGIAWADVNRTVMGYPPITQPDSGFWAPMSLARNAARIDTPILMQLADREYPVAIEAFMALRERHKPVDMYVFPDEYHIKVDPRHRLAVYQRATDWFDFWLRGAVDPDPTKAAQYKRWYALRGQSVAQK
jgi:dipeptidyl aminopeptidase/acylaminoacyl peptidase